MAKIERRQKHVLNISIPFLLWIISPILFGCAALLLGQDANWDLRNYHFYIPYAFLEGRLDYDVAPAHVANFYNPLLYIPFYYGVTLLPPKLLSFLIGAVQGMNAPVIFAIVSRLHKKGGYPHPSVIPLSLAILAVTGAGFIYEIGTSFADTVLSLAVFASLRMNMTTLTGKPERRPTGSVWTRLFLSGIVAGAAAGLKQPFLIYAVGLCGAFLVTMKIRQGFMMAFAFGLGVLAGIILTDGFWLYEMWTRYGNPLFPYFNDIFRSPWGSEGSYRDTRFLPHGLKDALLFPFNFVFNPLGTGETVFRDLRIAFLFVVSVIWALTALWKKRVKPSAQAGVRALLPEERYLLCFMLLSFTVWLKMFAIYRYIIPIEMLAPVAAWLLLYKTFGGMRSFLPGLAAATLVLITSTKPGSWGRVPWGEDYFGVDVPCISEPQRTIILMGGTDPLAYLIPLFPREVRFLRIQSWFTGPSASPNRFDLLMQDLIKNHEGPLFTFFRAYERQTYLPVLAAYGLTIDMNGCIPVPARIEAGIGEPLYLCPVSHERTKKGHLP